MIPVLVKLSHVPRQRISPAVSSLRLEFNAWLSCLASGSVSSVIVVALGIDAFFCTTGKATWQHVFILAVWDRHSLASLESADRVGPFYWNPAPGRPESSEFTFPIF